ncbi:CcdB family protein [Rheinheimera sediminis]|uniref:CcdB family protein n=1 Tax=Rheinheimera sp. YQF-1 TaxID=2499626 RepID=UPI001C96D23C|nr:CcdB family protein [Rheinheimera sp. YQF-1]
MLCTLIPVVISQAHYPYLVDIQSAVLTDLVIRIVIPLRRSSAFGAGAINRLTSLISFKGEQLLLLTPQIASIPVKHLKNPVGTLAHFRERIVAALDLAIKGI